MTAAAPVFEPRIVGFLCTFCAYAGADRAGASQKSYPPNVHVVRVPCSGRVDPQLVLQAFREGADGVVVLACHPGDCHFKEGNVRAERRAGLLGPFLVQHGIAPERFRFDHVSATEDAKYVRIVTEMTEAVRALGPLR